jgi:hypothetical protein
VTFPEAGPLGWPDHSRADFDAYIAELLDTCRRHPHITGLVLMGSTADRTRADEWSDHDFALVCTSGFQEALRSDLRWLPRSASLVAAGREHHDGFKAVYANGHVVATFHANDFDVAYDCGGVEGVMNNVASRAVPGAAIDLEQDMAIFLASILIGVGRARRGETLSASGSIRGLAIERLLALLAQVVPTDHPSQRDTLDPRRRFERSFPEIGLALAAALDSPVEQCAEQLLDIAHERLAGRWGKYPIEADQALRRRLSWRTRPALTPPGDCSR